MTKIFKFVPLLLAVILLASCGAPVDTGDGGALGVIAPSSPEYGVIGIEDSLLIGGVTCENALLTRVNGLEAVAACRSARQMYPASMTKVMTFIVAYEYALSLEDKMTITQDIKNSYADASRKGIDVGDILTVEQLLYALLLESDTDAALTLAVNIAGSEERFVALMNSKCQELGLTDTHFTNATGLHHREHYTTAADMTSIFAYALENQLFRDIITTDTYVTRFEYYEEGELKDYRMTFWNTTISSHKGRFADSGISLEFDGGKIIGGKTGYTPEAKYCLALLIMGNDGEEYILITAGSDSKKKNAEDCYYICENYLKGN